MTDANRERWFRPPRPHGQLDEERTVSFLELFYDLVFVVLIAQIAHTLADHVTWTGLRDFVIVFGLIWIAWVNGTLYHDLHGGDDGRSRSYVFLQMMLLVPLAVFAGHAADDVGDGRGFAIVYGLLMMLIAWQWFDVRRFDTPEWRRVAGRYVQGMVVIVAIVFASALTDNQDVRLWLWAIAVVITLIGNIVLALTGRTDDMTDAMQVTESLAERFGLFIIIVLGEVVVGVVDGLSEAEHTFRPIATGVLALWIGFAFWWTYFDLVGGRTPTGTRQRVVWLFGHLPLAISISAAGAGMVGLIEHAADGRTPASNAWLISGGTAGVALSIALLSQTIPEHQGRRLVPTFLGMAAVASLVAGAARPVPWLLALLLYAALSAVWTESFRRRWHHA
ncbi:MAG: low temperature requirement protein A [Acidimicrobiales bacterium]|nr:low temperature requirement protein A [Acidimicrobiales bacterium]